MTKEKKEKKKDHFDDIMEILDEYEEGYIPRDNSDFEM